MSDSEKNLPEIRRIKKIPEKEINKALTDIYADENLKKPHKLFDKLIKPGSIPNYSFAKDETDNQFTVETIVDKKNKNVIIGKTPEFDKLIDKKGIIVSLHQRLLSLGLIKIEFYLSHKIQKYSDNKDIPLHLMYFNDLLQQKELKKTNTELFDILKDMNIKDDQVYTFVRGGVKKGKTIPNGLYKISGNFYEGLMEGLEKKLFNDQMETKGVKDLLQSKVLLFTGNFLEKAALNLPIIKT